LYFLERFIALAIKTKLLKPSSITLAASSELAYRREGVFFPIENALSAGKGDGSAQRGQSMLSTIALFFEYQLCISCVLMCACSILI